MLRTRWLVPGVVALGVVLTAALTALNLYAAGISAQQRLEVVATSVADSLEQELERVVDLATAIAVALPPPAALDEAAWQRIMTDLAVADRHPAVFGSSYNQRVARADLDRWLAGRRAEDPVFALRGDAGEPTLQLIRYAWPLPDTAQSVGLDVLVSAQNRAAFARAEATGEPTFIAAFQSSSLPTGEPATALLLPVEGRDSAVVLLLAGDTLLSTLEPLPAAVTVALLEPDNETFPVIATLPGPDGEEAVTADGSIDEDLATLRLPIRPEQSGWELSISEAPGLTPALTTAGPWLALTVGLVITALAGATTHTLTSRERLAARRVEEATQELAAANTALLDADRHKDAFIASISHELRTPLTAISGFLETLRRIPPDQIPADTLLDPLERNTARLRTLVDDLLLLASLDAGAAAARPEPVALSTALPTLVDDLGFDPADCRVELAEPLHVHVDPHHLERIVSNLVHNALHHGAAPVHIRGREVDDHVVVTVADSGSGLDPAEAERVFDRFTRGRDAEQSTGTGLGLAVVRELAVANGGEITYRRCEDGPCFELTLPRAA